MREQGPVPHHRVTQTLHAKAKKKADKAGLSMSQIAVAGLTEYVSRISEKVPAGTSESELSEMPHVTQSLPEPTQIEVQRMKVERDPVMNRFLMALFDAGWSLQAIAEPLQVSRQAIYIRIRRERAATAAELAAAKKAAKAAGDPVPTSLPEPPMPDVPKAPFLPSGPGRNKAKKTDWAVWVDRDMYETAAKHARWSGTPMHEVMEEILRDYVEGRLVIGG